MREDIRQQFSCGEILRITGDDFHLLAVVRIREVDEIVDDVIQPFLSEHAFHHRIQRVDAVRWTVRLLYAPPGEEIFVVREDASGLRVHAVGQHGKAVVFEQFRNVPHVSCRDLHICVMNRRVFLDGGFEFHHDHWQAVDIDDGVRPTGCFRSFDGHLVDDFDDILVVSLVKINQSQMEVFGATIFADKRLAFNHAEEHASIGTVYRRCGGIP